MDKRKLKTILCSAMTALGLSFIVGCGGDQQPDPPPPVPGYSDPYTPAPTPMTLTPEGMEQPPAPPAR